MKEREIVREITREIVREKERERERQRDQGGPIKTKIERPRKKDLEEDCLKICKRISLKSLKLSFFKVKLKKLKNKRLNIILL